MWPRNRKPSWKPTLPRGNLLDSRRRIWGDFLAQTFGVVMAGLLDDMRPLVDRTIDRLAKTRYRVDPIGGEKFSQTTSIVSAAYKRHGQIIEEALLKQLAKCSYFQVWREPTFLISPMADHAIRARNADADNSLPMDLPYGDPGRKVQVDLLVFDDRIDSLRAYEVKRGNGQFDAGKKRSILQDVLCIRALLRDYGRKRGLKPSVVESRLISYYGVRALPDPLNLFGNDLDNHFVFPVIAEIESVNGYFRERLYELLEKITGGQAAMFCPDCPYLRAKADTEDSLPSLH